MKTIRNFRLILPGEIDAEALVSQKPLSFWGGVDMASGDIIDTHHDLFGKNLQEKILCIPYDRGSCSGSGVLIEMVRRGTAPTGILCIEAEPVLALGPLIAEKMYGKGMALRTIAESDYAALQDACRIRFTPDAVLVLERS